MQKESFALNKAFITFQILKRPYIYLKWAESADGFIDIHRNDASQPPVILSSPETMAVDITIINEHGFPLPMGTPFDFFGPKAHINNEAFLLKSEQLTSEEYNNRLLLRRIMKKAGFHTIAYEWWHFNACSRSEARMKYPMIP